MNAPNRRITIGLTQGEMHISLPGNRPVDNATIEALRRIGEGELSRLSDGGYVCDMCGAADDCHKPDCPWREVGPCQCGQPANCVAPHCLGVSDDPDVRADGTYRADWPR